MKQKSLLFTIFILLVFSVFIFGGASTLFGKKMSHSVESMKTTHPFHGSPCSFMNPEAVCFMSFVEHLHYFQNLLAASIPETGFLLILMLFAIFIFKKTRQWTLLRYGGFKHRGGILFRSLSSHIQHFLLVPEFQHALPEAHHFVKLHSRLYA